VDRYTLLRATSSTERQCATIDKNKGGGEGVRQPASKGKVCAYWEERGLGGETPKYILYI
jgi:hypothetical protein